MQKQKKNDQKADTFDLSVVSNLAKYAMFPAYPTSFIVAADATVEVSQPSPFLSMHD